MNLRDTELALKRLRKSNQETFARIQKELWSQLNNNLPHEIYQQLALDLINVMPLKKLPSTSKDEPCDPMFIFTINSCTKSDVKTKIRTKDDFRLYIIEFYTKFKAYPTISVDLENLELKITDDYFVDWKRDSNKVKSKAIDGFYKKQ